MGFTYSLQATIAMHSKTLILLALLSPFACAKDVNVRSPDGLIVLTVSDDKAHPSYHVSYRGKPVIVPSRLGLVFKDHASFGEGFVIAESTPAQTDTLWTQPLGRAKTCARSSQ